MWAPSDSANIFITEYNIFKTHSHYTTFTHTFNPDKILSLLLLLHILLKLCGKPSSHNLEHFKQLSFQCCTFE